MYIKQIIIQGFKSYKDQTVIEPFSPRHNVVVGRNGSGKSNFFWAIRFVLSDAYSNMTRAERQSLLHEGTGAATISAYVEMIFDNSDNRFPTGKDEVILRRTIGAKKDEYSLDRKSVTKSEVMNLLESAGFSKANPYYIVPQGRITALTNAKDAERLALLKEVAGTRVYETRRQESLKIMEETDSKRVKIQELLEFIEGRLTELEEEKNELKEFQESDRDRRCLEYAIYSRQQAEAIENLEILNESYQMELEESRVKYQQSSDRARTIMELEQAIQLLKGEITSFSMEKNQLEEDVELLLKKRTQMELVIQDSAEKDSRQQQKKNSLELELNELTRTIEEKERRLAQISPEWENLVAAETQKKSQLEAVQAELATLESKRDRLSKFKSTGERDGWVRARIQEREEDAIACNDQIKDLSRTLSEAQGRLTHLEQECQNESQRQTSVRESLAKVQESFREVRGEKEKLETRRREIWRDEARLTATMDTDKEQRAKLERSFFGAVDRNTANGIKAVRRIAASLGLTGVYGPLYELFTVNERYTAAADVVAGSSLFHVVVDSDDTASRILEVLNKEKSGRVTFMPLNRLNPKPASYPDSNQAVPLISKLAFDSLLENAFQQVFGKAIVCPSLEVASGFARSHGLTAVTLAGDRADKKGALTGGFHDERQSRLDIAMNLRQIETKVSDAELDLEKNKNALVSIDKDLLQIRDQMAKLESRQRELQTESGLKKSKKTRLAEESDLNELIISRTKALRTAESRLSAIQTEIDSFSEELGKPLRNRLAQEDESRLEDLSQRKKTLSQEYSRLCEERTQAEAQVNVLKIELTTNLKAQQDEIRQQLDQIQTFAHSSQASDNLESQLHVLDESIAAMKKRLSIIIEDLAEKEQELGEQASSLEKEKANYANGRQELDKHQRAIDKFSNKKAVLVKQKEEAVQLIRELGVLPEEAFAKYQDTETTKLFNRLKKVHETLKKFSHVNKKAFEQYNNFTKQKEQLETRQEELEKSGNAIQELIKALDQRKDEAIEQTFQQVSEFFSSVWERLVPQGRGELLMIKKEESENTKSAGRRKSAASLDQSIERYSGIAIQVSFNSRSDEGLRMHQLSGGQKSLVALALIFAIQQSDPAPFYLFDEIDAALDSQYRTAVAEMVHELSENAQFITTTFRPELLVHADKFYGVTFSNKVSRIQAITRDDAQQFVEGQAAGAQ